MSLPWLLRHPQFSQQLLLLKNAADDQLWPLLIASAQFDLNFLETLQLDKLAREKVGPGTPLGLSTKSVRLALLGSSTVEQLLPGIRVGGLRHHLWIDTYVPDYGQGLQELLDPSSRLYQFKPTVVLVAFDLFQLFGSRPPAFSRTGQEEKLSLALEQLRTIWKLTKEKFGCSVIQQVPLPLGLPLMGSNEQRAFDSLAWLGEELRVRLRALAETEKIDLLDPIPWVLRDGLKAWHDPGLWHKAKQEVSPVAAPAYGELVARVLAAQQGRSFKCLVLDLDNTLWGGVIGDDGLEGIQLGQGNALGEAYLAFQRYVRDLAARGIILAVCSKNDEANAKGPFEKHPEMVLKTTDIACFVANWKDKASNLHRIAESLNIGLDAMVFVDDNPYERGQVRAELPMVAVPELPEDPALFPEYLALAGYFEAVALTEDDRVRSEQYQKNQARDREKTGASDLAGYLKGLNMELVWGPFDDLSLPRVTQLINKTNQFNLTTKRYSEEETRRFVSAPHTVTLRCRLKDKFGDNGIVGVMIAKLEKGDTWSIDTWLMSCRVLGREVEKAMLDLLANEVWALGGRRLVGWYIPTAKNAMVKDHYSRLGFTLLDENSGEARWGLELEEREGLTYPITLVRGE